MVWINILRTRRRSMKILLLTLLISTSSYANTSWKLPDLARASNALLVEMDSIGANKKSNCGLITSQISQASQNLQILVDERISKIQTQSSQIKSLLKNCKADCSCDIYQYALEKIDPNDRSANGPSKMTAEQRKTCFQKLTNFCSSKLFQMLLKK